MSSTCADLEVWRAAMDFIVRVYQLSKKFPKEEIYSLTSHIRRAAPSVPSNIAEGKGRFSDRELTHFLSNARGSLFEIETQVRLAQRLGYVSQEESGQLLRDAARVGQMINGLIRSVRPAA